VTGPGFGAAADVREQSPAVRLLTTECIGAAWGVDADAVERIVSRSEWLEQSPLDVAQALELRPIADALERVLVVRGASRAKALLSQGKLTLFEFLASDVQMVPNIVYGKNLGLVRSVVLEAAKLPVLICDPDTLSSIVQRFEVDGQARG
jgi:hypothetical protein